MRIPALLKLILLTIAAVVIFNLPGWLVGAPIPASLYWPYLVFTVIVIVLVMTITDEGTEELLGPLNSLARDPSKRTLKWCILITLPVIAGLLTFINLSTAPEPPVTLRVAHPPPPASFAAFEKTFSPQTLENPLRGLESSKPGRFAALVKEGGAIYFENCLFCHGAKLRGEGHLSAGLNPKPPPLAGIDTIAQLTEAYVFWRIATGGPGLPGEGAPELSAMPPWKDSLTEDEIWKVILFIYDYSGTRPRVFKESEEE